MRRLFAWILILAGLTAVNLAIVFDVGSLHRRIRCSMSHAAYFNTGDTPLHNPSKKEQFITKEDLQPCSDKVRRRYELVVTDGYLSANPESHLQTCCFMVLGALLVTSGVLHIRDLPKGNSKQ